MCLLSMYLTSNKRNFSCACSPCIVLYQESFQVTASRGMRHRLDDGLGGRSLAARQHVQEAALEDGSVQGLQRRRRIRRLHEARQRYSLGLLGPPATSFSSSAQGAGFGCDSSFLPSHQVALQSEPSRMTVTRETLPNFSCSWLLREKTMCHVLRWRTRCIS